MLWSLYFSCHPCKASESVPPDPMISDSFHGTDLTTIHGDKIDVALYDSSAIPRILFSGGFFLANTSAAVLSITPDFSDVCLSGNKNPPSPIYKYNECLCTIYPLKQGFKIMMTLLLGLSPALIP